MSRIEMEDEDWILFTDKFFDLIYLFSGADVNDDHPRWNRICELRNMVADFIEEEKYIIEHEEND